MNGASLLQAARGPVLLITLGALFLLHQNTEHNFNRTFPVLLIVFGLMRLMEFFVTRNEEPAVAGYGVGGPIPPQYSQPTYVPPVVKQPAAGDAGDIRWRGEAPSSGESPSSGEGSMSGESSSGEASPKEEGGNS